MGCFFNVVLVTHSPAPRRQTALAAIERFALRDKRGLLFRGHFLNLKNRNPKLPALLLNQYICQRLVVINGR
jgi:hypothetical protein